MTHGKFLEAIEFLEDGSSRIDTVVIAGIPYPVPDDYSRLRSQRIMQRLGIPLIKTEGSGTGISCRSPP